MIFWRKKFKISTRYPSKIDRGKTRQIAVLPHYISRGGCVFAIFFFFQAWYVQENYFSTWNGLEQPFDQCYYPKSWKKQKKKFSLFSTIFHLYLDYKFLDCFGTTVHWLKNHSGLSKLVFKTLFFISDHYLNTVEKYLFWWKIKEHSILSAWLRYFKSTITKASLKWFPTLAILTYLDI